MNAAVKKDMKPAEAFAARQAIKAAIEKESLQKTGLPSDVVTLYHGGLCHLYRYKRYTDVRLVMAPEQSTLYFGSADYPCYHLDVCFFRTYEDGKPRQGGTLFQVEQGRPPPKAILCSSPAIRALPTAWKRMTSSCIAVSAAELAVLPQPATDATSGPGAIRSTRGEQAQMVIDDWHHLTHTLRAVAEQYHGLLDPAILRQREKADRAAPG